MSFLEWQKTTLGQITDFLSGGTPSKEVSDYWGGQIPWASAKDMKQYQLEDTTDHITERATMDGTKIVPAGTVLILTRGMTLLNDVPICLIRRPMAFNQDVKALRPKNNVEAAFLPYIFLGNKKRLLDLVDLAGHGTGRLNTEELKALDIELPSTPEQKAILEIADWIEDQLETASGTQSAAELEKLRKTTGSLVSRSEVTRKTLVDDMAQSRYYEQRWLLDPARIISLLFVGPVGIDTFIEKFVHVPHPDKLGHQVGEAAAAVGLYLAFKKHADALVGKAYKQVKRAPANVRKVALASAFEVAVRFKPVNDIEPSHPSELRGGNRVVIALKQ